MMRKLLLLLCFVAIVYSAVNACDMTALIAREGGSLSAFPRQDNGNAFNTFNDPYDYLGYIMNRSNASLQNDGYGILYYPQNQFHIDSGNYWYKLVRSAAEQNRVYYTGDYFVSDNSPDLLDEAMDWIMSDYADAAIVMCHARNASANPFAPGNHPFRMNINNRTYTMMHNGALSTAARSYMINETNLIYPNWFATRLPNYPDFANSAYPAYWIDTEVMFHFIMAHVVTHNNNMFLGLKVALNKLKPHLKKSNNVANIILSDGQRLFVFRSTPLSGINSSYKLCYRMVGNGFWGIRTGDLLSGDKPLDQYELVVFSRDKAPIHYPGFIWDNLDNGNQYNYEPSLQTSTSATTIISGDHLTINISFQLDKSTPIKLKVYNQKGQFVRLLTDNIYAAGVHRIVWDGADKQGRAVGRGVYLLEMQSGKQRTVSKVLMLGR
jgi:hypothetical protein